MSQIPTVRGLIDSSELGVTLIHEHICLLSDGQPQAVFRDRLRAALSGDEVDEAIAG